MPALGPVAARRVSAFAHVLSLAGPLQSIEDRYDYSIKKNLRTAAKNGVVVRDARTVDDVDAYYELTQAVAVKYGRSSYSRDLFHTIFRRMVRSGEATITLAVVGDQPASGAVHVMTKDHVFNWLTASHPDLLPSRPNEAVIAHAIRSAVERKSVTYNLGASPATADGLIRFKEKWGALRHDYSTYEINSAALSGLLGKTVRKVRYFLRDHFRI
jgi:lipid II:glycine glycyltransferase (peptidoglycan interpeptide bridge formation enzyme)